VGAKTAIPVPEPTVARTLSPTNATTQTNTTSPTLNSTQSGVPVDTPRPSGKSVISPSPTPLPGDRTVSAEFAALMQDFQSNNLARTSVDGYLTIGAGQCLSSDQPGVAPINDYQYNGLQVVGSVTTPLKCAQSCEICLCGLGFRGFYYVGFELTASNKCNCLLNYDTLPGNLTRDDLGMIAGECSLFDSNSIIPSTGSLYTGTGPVIGSVGFGDQYLCYSIGKDEPPAVNDENFKARCATESPSISTAPSHLPTYQPSISTAPSNKPSEGPSVSTHPTISAKPTASPSANPTKTPEPSTSPSISSRPSDKPSDSPSVSLNPTHQPTPRPTKKPVTPRPTKKPTPKPTRRPSISPTISPTFTPTISPTLEPTISPTMSPTLEPTISPTMEPTFQPTVDPTMEPTLNPTVEPTQHPTVTQEPTGPPAPFDLLPTTFKPTYRKPWNPGWPQPKPPSWDSGWPKPPPSWSSDTDDWIINPPSGDKPPPAKDDDWRPIFPGKASKTKSSKWLQGSWTAGAKGSKSKSGCIHINGGKYTDDGYPCVGYDDDRVGGKSEKGNYAGYSIIDFQSVVVRNAGERIQSRGVGLSLVLLFCLSMLL